MTYKHNEYNLVKAETNAMNYILLKNLDTGVHTVIDWDLDDSEIDEIVLKFGNDALTDDDIQNDGASYESFEDFQSKYNCFTIIA